jgi:hypothetical protein
LVGLRRPTKPRIASPVGVVGIADGHDEAVAEEVAVVGRTVVAFTLGDETGLCEFVERGALVGEVAHQAAAAAGCVSEGVVGVVGGVGPHPLAQVARRPRARVAGLEVGQGLLVELVDPLGRDLDRVGEGVLGGDLVGLLPRQRRGVRVLHVRVVAGRDVVVRRRVVLVRRRFSVDRLGGEVVVLTCSRQDERCVLSVSVAAARGVFR